MFQVLIVLSLTAFAMGDQISHQMVKRIHGPAIDSVVNHGYLGYHPNNHYTQYQHKPVKYTKPVSKPAIHSETPVKSDYRKVLNQLMPI